MRVRPRLEKLTDRILPTVYAVGPGQAYRTLHDVPWTQLGAGDEVDVYWKPTPYHDKILLSRSGMADAPIQIIGIAGPHGELPVIDGDGARESADSYYFTDQVSAQGIITVAPDGYVPWTDEVGYINIVGLELVHATRDYTFIGPDGNVHSYNWAAAGVAIYRAHDVAIENCIIHETENGIFGKSFGWEGGDLTNIWISGNDISHFGVPGDDHYHGVYLEAIHSFYLFNWIHDQTAGSSGSGIKDRSDCPVIAYNRIETGAHLLDLVDPEDGAPTLCAQPDFGWVAVYGNILVNTGATTLIHFGFDALEPGAQQGLCFWDNTVINWNSYPDGGRYYTCVFKIDGGGTVYAWNNIFHSLSWDGRWSGEFYLATGEYDPGQVVLGVNWAPNWVQPGDDQVSGWENLITGEDPGFVDVFNGDYRLRADSPCVGQATDRFDGVPPVEFQWDPVNQVWVQRDGCSSLGASEAVGSGSTCYRNHPLSVDELRALAPLFPEHEFA